MIDSESMVLTFSKASHCACPHTNLSHFLVSLVMGSSILTCYGINS